MILRPVTRGLFSLALVCGLVAPIAVAADFPDLGPPLRKFDPKNEKDCPCVFSALKRARYLRDGYKALAESYKDTLKDLGNGKDTPAWVDPNILNEQQLKRLIEFNKTFDAEELKMAQAAPASDCGFPEDKDLVLQTSPLTGELPNADRQKEVKPLFPFEELYDAVMRHEAHHSAQFSANNDGANRPAGRLPRTRTPWGRALEEAQGYAIEIEELEKLEKRCKVSFKNLKLGMRTGTPPDELVLTETISGYVCGDPHSAVWTLTQRRTQIAGGVVISDYEDPPSDTDCVEPGSDVAAHYENVIKNSPRNANSWYCMYTQGPPPRVIIRTPKMTMGMPGGEWRLDPPQDRVVEAEIGACEEERAPDKPEDAAPVPVS